MSQCVPRFLVERRRYHPRLVVDQRGLRRLYEKGRGGVGWYDGALDALRETYAGDAPIVAAMIAATSPLCPVPKNVERAARAYSAFATGESFANLEFGVARSTILRNLERVTKGQEVVGQKCAAFARNILGDTNAVTVDRWIWRVFFGIDTGKTRAHAFVVAWITRNAALAGVAPRDYQAALWVGKKLEAGVRGDETVAPLRDVIREVLNRPASEGGD